MMIKFSKEKVILVPIGGGLFTDVSVKISVESCWNTDVAHGMIDALFESADAYALPQKEPRSED